MNLTDIQKNEIQVALDRYLVEQGTDEKRFSLEKFQAISNVNKAYLSEILKGNRHMPTGKGLSPIKDDVFIKIAESVGYSILAPVWKHYTNPNFKRIIATFEEARQGDILGIDGNTGEGKSYSVRKYVQTNRHETFLITATDDMTVKGFLEEIAGELNVAVGKQVTMRKAIVGKLKTMVKPLLIIDEAENLKDNSWKTVKTLIDAVKNENEADARTYHCGIVILGMGIKDKIHDKAAKNKGVFPQINRRFAGSWRRLFKIDSAEIKDTCIDFAITDAKSILFLQSYVKNMGTLARVISRLMKATQGSGELVDLELVRSVFEE